MANRKKKKTQAQPSVFRRLEITKTYFDKYSEVARKVLQVLELDPALYDQFTKKQKLKMMQLKSDPPRVKTQAGHSVPRHYLKKVQQEVYDLVKLYPVKDDIELNLTYSDFLTYGLSFICYAMVQEKKEEPIEHKDIYQQIGERGDQILNNSEDGIMMTLWLLLRYIMLGITKINFRIYGFDWKWITDSCSYRMGVTISVSAVSPRKTHFVYNNKSRPAYQAIRGQFLGLDPTPITIPYNKVIEDSDQAHQLEVYVQNHVFTRMKERIDVLPVELRIYCLNTSLICCQSTILHNGQRAIIFTEDSTGTFGYLPFTIIGKKLFVLTFLPICSQNAHEGKKLQEILGISRKETEFLGMDKLSFFLDTDFDAIPRLKQAVIDAGLWHLTTLEPLPNYEPQNPMSTATLLRFFQTERSHAEVLSEIVEVD